MILCEHLSNWWGNCSCESKSRQNPDKSITRTFPSKAEESAVFNADGIRGGMSHFCKPIREKHQGHEDFSFEDQGQNQKDCDCFAPKEINLYDQRWKWTPVKGFKLNR